MRDDQVAVNSLQINAYSPLRSRFIKLTKNGQGGGADGLIKDLKHMLHI